MAIKNVFCEASIRMKRFLARGGTNPLLFFFSRERKRFEIVDFDTNFGNSFIEATNISEEIAFGISYLVRIETLLQCFATVVQVNHHSKFLVLNSKRMYVNQNLVYREGERGS